MQQIIFLKVHVEIVTDFKAQFMREKIVLGRGFPRLPELPWASKLFEHFLTKLGEPFTYGKSWLG